MGDQPSSGLGFVTGGNFDFLDALNDVVVSQNVTAWIDDNTGAHAVNMFDAAFGKFAFVGNRFTAP